MKLWHSYLIDALPGQLLKAQHRDCCAIRGKNWGKSKSPRMRWLWNYTAQSVEFYHLIVLDEMAKRGWRTSPNWRIAGYRGKKSKAIPENWIVTPDDWPQSLIFKEHNHSYLARDIHDLKAWCVSHKISDGDLSRISKWL